MCLNLPCGVINFVANSKIPQFYFICYVVFISEVKLNLVGNIDFENGFDFRSLLIFRVETETGTWVCLKYVLWAPDYTNFCFHTVKEILAELWQI